MNIEKLGAWTNAGSTQMAINSHQSIRKTLEAANFSKELRYDVFLQGSYKNSTNIRGDSDVDIVVESSDFFFHNLDREQAKLKGIISSDITWDEIDNKVSRILIEKYGERKVTRKGKSIKVDFSSTSYAKADVVVAFKYRKYESNGKFSEGIAFKNRNNQQIIVNYPKQHYENGIVKSQDTNGLFKSYVRMIKNARNYCISNGIGPNFDAPSYFIECLIYNLKNSIIKQSPKDFLKEIIDIWEYHDNSSDRCQNGISHMYGYDETCWTKNNKNQFAAALRNMMSYQ